jgi:hypothetical protein
LKETSRLTSQHLLLSLQNTILNNRLEQTESLSSTQSIELSSCYDKLKYYEGDEQTILSMISLDKCNDMIHSLQSALTKLINRKEHLMKQSVETQFVCIICREKWKSVVLLPCNHLCYCYQCYINHPLPTCPICRNNVQTHQQIYF